MKKFLKFSLSGAIGFIIHGTIFNITISYLNIYLSYSIAFLTAVNVSYLINKNFTFKEKGINYKLTHYFLYTLGQTKGFLINYTIFKILIYFSRNDFSNRNIAFIIASIITMIFNYFYAKKIVFTSR